MSVIIEFDKKEKEFDEKRQGGIPMAKEVTTYQCPACMGPLHFSGKSGKLECEYCGSAYTVEEIEKLYEKPVTENVWTGEETAGMKTYSCPSCGAELLCDANTAAGSCPYCGNPTIIPGQFEGGIKPDLILPFKMEKAAAKKALLHFYQGKKFLPDSFKEQNHIEEIKGVYVPFWLYDYTVSGEAEFDARRVRVYHRGEWRITETSHYLVRRKGSMDFTRVPADASKKMQDDYMDAVEPFDYSEIKPFSPAYLPGFFADKYDVDKKEGAERAGERVRNSVAAAMEETVQGYQTVIPGEQRFHTRQNRAEYALFPVWLLSTRWNGESFLFAMNGQTGRLAGELPVDKKKYWLWFAGIMAAVMAVFSVLWFLLSADSGLLTGGFAGLLLSAVTAFLVCSSFKKEMKTTGLQNRAQMYAAQSGLTLTEKEDRFLRVTQTRQRVQSSASHGDGPGMEPGRGFGAVHGRREGHGPGPSRHGRRM